MKKAIFTLTAVFALGNVSLNAQVTSGLVAKYSFNGGNANDEVGFNSGIVSGATLTADRFGNANKAFHFDGIDDVIDFGNAVTFEFGQTDFSISLWTRFSIAQFAPLINKRNDNPTFDQYSIFVGQVGTPNNALNCYFKPSPGGVGAPERSVTSTSLDSTWHNIVVTHSFSDSTSLFIDGAFVGKSATAFSTENFDITGANLMAGYTNVLGNDYYFNGDLDDIRIYAKQLNTMEIDSLFNEPNPLATGVNGGQISSKSIGVYPNPATDRINFSMNSNVQLSNISGQVISIKKNVTTLDLSDQPSGMYFLTFFDSEGQVMQHSKIAKN